MKDVHERLRDAVKHFWQTRKAQGYRQGTGTGQRDQGARTAVTGGAQMDGFADLVRDILLDSGVPALAIYRKKAIELPGDFRAENKWDLLVVVDGCLLTGIEFKSQVGPSFGNNFNNRSEEALGSATDVWAAYREGAFKPSPRPWLGYLMLLEEAAGSTEPVKVREPPFSVFPEFKEASYAKRYEILLTKLLRERLYDGATLILSTKRGVFREPSVELSFQQFVSSLIARVTAGIETK